MPYLNLERGEPCAELWGLMHFPEDEAKRRGYIATLWSGFYPKYERAGLEIGAFVCRHAFAPGTPLARDHPDAAITPRPRRGDDVAGYDRRQLLDDPRSAA